MRRVNLWSKFGKELFVNRVLLLNRRRWQRNIDVQRKLAIQVRCTHLNIVQLLTKQPDLLALLLILEAQISQLVTAFAAFVMPGTRSADIHKKAGDEDT